MVVPMRRRKSNPKKRRAPKARRSARQQETGVRGLAAITRVRRGESSNLTQAAEAEHTTVKSIRQSFPAALIQDHPGGRIRVKAGDPYSAQVEIMTETGPLTVTARGSRERELAGRHRATYMQVLRGNKPASALEQFRGKKVGGQELITDFDQLSVLAQAGVMDQLDSLYVSPDTGR